MHLNRNLLNAALSLTLIAQSAAANSGTSLLCEGIDNPYFKVFLKTNADYNEEEEPRNRYGAGGSLYAPAGLDIEIAKEFGESQRKKMSFQRKGAGQLGSGMIWIYPTDARYIDSESVIATLTLEPCRFRECSSELRGVYQESPLPAVEMHCTFNPRNFR